MRKKLILFGLIVLTGLFLWTRLYQLPLTFDMFGDSARDLLELAEWRQTKMPPLLGPHTSAISFNQSAWYFYYLFPFYLISGQSLYTSQIAIICWYLGWLFIGYRWGERYGLTKGKLLLLWFVIVLHPQLIAQTRTVWNPSLILPLLIAVLLIQLQWVKYKATNKELFVWSFLTMLSVGCSYSVIPTVGLMGIAALMSLKRKGIWLVVFLATAFIMVNIGTIGYELKYHFLLTKNLPNQQVLQTSTDYGDKIRRIGTFLLGRPL